MSVIPAPIQVSPSGTFDGDDGSWSSFSLRVGNPAQIVRVLPSTLIPESWVVFPAGCTDSDFSNCGVLRGELFQNDSSTTWSPIGNGVPYSLSVEGNLQITTEDGGYYAYDTLGLSTPDGAGIVLDHQVVAGIVTPDFWIGNLGLAARTSDVDNQNQTSFLKTLQADNKIPSLSYGYTAGAWYRNATFGSLTLGGQDLSRFEPNGVNFTMSQESSRDLTVGLQSITLLDGGKESSLLTDGILTFVDSTLPNIWLPMSACSAFATAFGLQFQPLSLLYTVNASMHSHNLKNNASVVFQLGNSVEGGDTVNITFPYSAFDLNYTDPSMQNPEPVSYFPLRQADVSNQYTLGRAFLQEAYLSVNYEFSNFSIAQALPVTGVPEPHIIPIPSINSPTSSNNGNNPSSGSGPTNPSGTAVTVAQSSSGISSGAIAGIVIAILLVAAGILGFLFWRRRNRRKQERVAQEAVAPPHMPELEQVEPVGGSYFALPTKAESSAYAGNKQPASITSDSDAQEMPSPPIDRGRYGPSASAVHDPTQPGHDALNAVELATSDAGASHELPSRPGSVNLHSRMSHGPSPSLNPQAPGALAPSDAYDMWPDTHFEPTSPTAPSVLSANSLTLTAAGPASLVSHTRGRSTPRTTSYTRSPPLSPLHSAGPSLDSTNGYHSNTGAALAPNVNIPDRSTGPSFDAPSVAAAISAAAASVGEGPVGGVAPAARDESQGAVPHPGSRQRAGSARSQASEGTLVNTYSRSASPEVGRHNNPANIGSISNGNGTAAADLHPEISFASPALVGLGYPGQRERERELAREQEAETARREQEAGPRDPTVEAGSLEYAYRAATTPEPMDPAELRANRQEAARRLGR